MLLSLLRAQLPLIWPSPWLQPFFLSPRLLSQSIKISCLNYLGKTLLGSSLEFYCISLLREPTAATLQRLLPPSPPFLTSGLGYFSEQRAANQHGRCAAQGSHDKAAADTASQCNLLCQRKRIVHFQGVLATWRQLLGQGDGG